MTHQIRKTLRVSAKHLALPFRMLSILAASAAFIPDAEANGSGGLPPSQTGYIIAAFMLPLIAILAVAGAYKRRSQAIEASSWPMVDAKVSEVQIAFRSVSGRNLRYVPTIFYNYSIDGRTYQGHTLSYEPPDLRTESGAAKWLGRYPVGRAIKVHVDPARPGESIIDPRMSIWAHILVVIVCLGAATACGIIAFNWPS